MLARRIVTIALGNAAAVVFAMPASASAAACTRDLDGGGRSTWTTAGGEGTFEDATQRDGQDPTGRRDDAFDRFGTPEIDGSQYMTPDANACERADGGDTLIFPTDEPVAGVEVRPQV